MMLRIGMGVAVLAVVAGPTAGGGKACRDRAAAEFLTGAVLAGLTEDGVPRGLAATLAKDDANFVAKCVICKATREALTKYGDGTDPVKAGRLTDAMRKRLESADRDARHAALRELTRAYTDRAFDRAKLSAADRKAYTEAYQDMRKEAAGGLPKGQPFCPSCDGACGIAPADVAKK